MISLVNFADKSFEAQRRWNSVSGKLIGGFDRVLEYGPKDLEETYLDSNKQLMQYSKGFGNYCWKSYIINKALTKIEEDDYLFYADSGSFFIRSIKPIINLLATSGKDIMCFTLPLIERQWTKRDALILLKCDEPEFYNTPQVMGTFILIKKTGRSLDFFKDFEKFSSDSRIISDEENVLGKENYPEFIAHRHDQSILSLMSKKSEVLIVNDPSDYGLFPHRIIHDENFLSEPNLMNPQQKVLKVTLLSNRLVHPFIYLIKYVARVLLYKLGMYNSKTIRSI